MNELIQAPPVWCENCNISSQNVYFKQIGADVNFEVICESCGTVVYCDPSEKIGRFPKTTLGMVHNSITTGGTYTGYCNAAVAMQTKLITEKAFYEMRDFLGEKKIQLLEKNIRNY